MRLLTIGVGLRGAKIAENFFKRGIRVNRVPLFKCFAILGNEAQMKSIAIKDDRKFYVHSKKGVLGFLNSITKIYEIWEGALVILSLEDEYAFEIAVEVNERVKETFEDPIITLPLIPTLGEVDMVELKRKLLELRKRSDVLLIFEGNVGVDERILRSMNLLALAGEVDLKRRVAGEVVVDTSDVFNALRSEGFSILGFAEQKIPFGIFRKKSELKAMRTRRMIELFDKALNNLSIQAKIEDAKSSLILFTGPKEEITMEGLFEVISKVESLNSGIEVRYGDCPMQEKKVSLVLLFSGLKAVKF
ncbi:MAG: cell division protein [Archaeoglobaceae archaeon]|uniref:Cell division protein n=1 Tax=Archaeoglobus fulgidus TaxID=2234 RepID=A0A7J3LZT8_ARCFL